jgi:integrase
MRCGEASLLEWVDVDFERRLVTITPEKGSNPRILPISMKLVEMLKNLPKTSNKVFPATLGSIKVNLFLTRRRIARKLDNPRLLKISFHTLRHWKGTMEYHKTKDLLHVQQVLGHRDIKSTMIYIHLEHALFNTASDEFHVKTANTVAEACKLVEVGFEYVTTIDNVQVFRKRK